MDELRYSMLLYFFHHFIHKSVSACSYIFLESDQNNIKQNITFHFYFYKELFYILWICLWAFPPAKNCINIIKEYMIPDEGVLLTFTKEMSGSYSNWHLKGFISPWTTRSFSHPSISFSSGEKVPNPPLYLSSFWLKSTSQLHQRDVNNSTRNTSAQEQQYFKNNSTKD